MKKIFIPLMLCAVAMSSCSKDEPNAESGSTYSSDLVSINVSSGTTRGTDTTTATLEGTEGSYGTVELFIFDDGSINSSYTFTYDGSDWGQSQIKWSDITFPATFLSMHDGTAQALTVSTEDEEATLDYTVSNESSTHKDLVYHASTLSAIPTGGVINAYHKHALSKINLYAATGGNKVYIARVQFVNVNDKGTATINAVTASETSTTNGLDWSNETSTDDYEYFYIDSYSGTYSFLQSTDDDGDPIINDDDDAPFMIIPQETTPTTSTNIASNGINATGSYLEVIYYMTDSNDMPIVGYSSVAALSNASDYIDADQDKTLYLMGAFPVDYDFEANKEYDITLGLGKSGSTGGILLVDYYVDQDGDPVELTKVDSTTSDDETEIPEIDPGDDILPNSDEYINITVDVYDWDDGDDVTVGIN